VPLSLSLICCFAICVTDSHGEKNNCTETESNCSSGDSDVENAASETDSNSAESVIHRSCSEETITFDVNESISWSDTSVDSWNAPTETYDSDCVDEL